MAPLELQGDTLGEKHQFYNKLLNEASATSQPLLEPSQDDDIRTLLNIDIACKRRNVEYILEVLKSEDQLYFSKAIKRSTWLFTDPQYAHIINPEYLYTELYPVMTLRAFNKLILNIRLHLKNEKRVEGFYNYIIHKNTNSAFKWLQHCSVPFVEIEVAKHNYKIPEHLVLRLFEKSYTIFDIFYEHRSWIITKSKFLLKNNVTKFLDKLEEFNIDYFNFNAQATKTLMEKCPERIIDNFEFYFKHIDVKTFAKYLHRSVNVQNFLLKYVHNKKMHSFYTYSYIQHFIKYLPKDSQFAFIKKLFIDKKIRDDGDFNSTFGWEPPVWSLPRATQNTNAYKWYTFAPFDTAFTDLRKLIRAESDPSQRSAIFQVILSCAGRNVDHIGTLLQYYGDKHINEPFKFKVQFVNTFLSNVETHLLDEKSWNILLKLFHSVEVFNESDNNVQICVTAIIVRNIYRNEQVPDIIQNKFVIDYTTLKIIQKTLKKQEDKESMFNYLRDLLIAAGKELNLSVESEFHEVVRLCEHLFNLVKLWRKELCDHPYALDRLKELIKVKKENLWSRDLSLLYNIKKAWRKIMFEESVALSPTENTCVNALKHDPELLSRNKEQVVSLFFNDNVSLRYLLSKIRIYWPNTLAADWKTTFLERLDQPGGHKALIVGLCTLLLPKQINELLKKYAPSESKIDWNETNQIELSLRKQIAKNVHKARPPAPVDGILLFAIGDYLQFAVPSLSAVLSQLSPNKSRRYIPMLLDAPVSLQKFGVRWAFHKLTAKELKQIFTKIWNSTKNLSIRTVLFTHTFESLCIEKDSFQIKETWDLLSMFIDNLTPDDNNVIFNRLAEISKIPDSIKPQFYVKSYNFINSLPAKCNCEMVFNSILGQATDCIENLDTDFVLNVLLKNFFELFDKSQHYIHHYVQVISIFILTSKDEKLQIQRYEMFLATILDKHLPQWDNIHEGEYCVKNNINEILERFAHNITYTFEKNKNIPLKIYKDILQKLENTLSYKKNYVVLTLWKLMVTYVKILDETELLTECYKKVADKKSITDEEKDKILSETHKQIAPLFAKTCGQHLKDDINSFGPSINILFSKAVEKLFSRYLSRSMCKSEDCVEYAICLFQDMNQKEMCLVAYHMSSMIYTKIYSDTEKTAYEELRKIVLSHPSDAIRVYYYELFCDVTPFVPSSQRN